MREAVAATSAWEASFARLHVALRRDASSDVAELMSLQAALADLLAACDAAHRSCTLGEVQRHKRVMALMETLDVSLDELKKTRVAAHEAYFRSAEGLDGKFQDGVVALGAWPLLAPSPARHVGSTSAVCARALLRSGATDGGGGGWQARGGRRGADGTSPQSGSPDDGNHLGTRESYAQDPEAGEGAAGSPGLGRRMRCSHAANRLSPLRRRVTPVGLR